MAGQFHADDLRNGKRVSQSQQSGFGVNAAHPPTQHPKRIHHGGVRVTTNDKFRAYPQVVVDFLLGDHAGNSLEIDLVDDAAARWKDAQALEGLLGPIDEGVALAVSLQLHLHVLHDGVRCAPMVHLDRVIDDQVHWHHGVN